MRGIAIATKDPAPIGPELRHSPTNLFLFFTEAKLGEFPMGNSVYKYELLDDNTKLANLKLPLNFPALPDDSHVGGAVDIGPDNNVYFTVGDQRPTAFNRIVYPDTYTKAQNYVNGIEADGRSGILRITQDGEFDIVVTGGESLYPLTGQTPYVAIQYVGFGFLNVDVINDGTTLSDKLFANDGKIKDQFTITKSVNISKTN
jgi:hypothetical protein